MGITKRLPRNAAMLCLLLGCVAGAHAQDEEAAVRASRWQQLHEQLFPGREILDGKWVVQIQAEARAHDAALVPVELQVLETARVTGIYLIIDENPAPLAAHVRFGPLADPHSMSLRVRVNAYTDMHAVAETSDGRLYATAHYIKASGGCSAPAGADDTQALRDIGLMRLRLSGPFEAGKPLQAQLMIRHPNFNGMQMDQVKRDFTPARFIRTIDASFAGREIFHVDADISLSTDPVIGFGFVPAAKGKVLVEVQDSDDVRFHHEFDVPEI